MLLSKEFSGNNHLSQIQSLRSFNLYLYDCVFLQVIEKTGVYVVFYIPRDFESQAFLHPQNLNFTNEATERHDIYILYVYFLQIHVYIYIYIYIHEYLIRSRMGIQRQKLWRCGVSCTVCHLRGRWTGVLRWVWEKETHTSPKLQSRASIPIFVGRVNIRVLDIYIYIFTSTVAKQQRRH